MVDLVLLTDNVSRIFFQIMLVIDGAVYWLMETAYQTFIVIANVRIFSSATFTEFAERIYALVGVIMLFIIAFQLLSNIVDPNKMDSGETSTAQIVKNIISTLAIIIILPTVFKYMYKIQDVVLDEKVIENIILGPSNTAVDVEKGGKMVATYVFSAFINVNGSEDAPDVTCQAYGGKLDFCNAYNKFIDPSSQWYGKVSIFSHKEASESENGEKASLLGILGISNGLNGYNYRKAIATEIDDGIVEYRFLISTAAGLICAYLFLSFSLDIGIRVAKLAYFQLISPIPVAFRILPKQKSVFDNWVKSLTSTYLDVFIRLIIVFFCVFLLSKLNEVWNSIINSSRYGDKSWMVSVLSKVIVIYGIFAFMKEAPKLIAKMFGLESGDMGFGIKGKLKKAAVFGENQPLSRENIARLNQNRIMKKQAKADGSTPGGRFIDRFGQNLGFGTRTERANAADDAEIAKLDSLDKEQNNAQIIKNASDVIGAQEAIKERAKAIAQNKKYDGGKYDRLHSEYERLANGGLVTSKVLHANGRVTTISKPASAENIARAKKAADDYSEEQAKIIAAAVINAKENDIDGNGKMSINGESYDVRAIDSAAKTITSISKESLQGESADDVAANLGRVTGQYKNAKHEAEGRSRDIATKKAGIMARRESSERRAMSADAHYVKNRKPPSGSK